MQLLPSTIQSVATNYRVDTFALCPIEVFAELAKIVIRFTNMLQLAGNQLNDDDVIKITNNRDIIGQNIFRIREIDEGCQQSFAIGFRELPFLIGQHVDQ